MQSNLLNVRSAMQAARGRQLYVAKALLSASLVTRLLTADLGNRSVTFQIDEILVTCPRGKSHKNIITF
jgi:hypothetical protein